MSVCECGVVSVGLMSVCECGVVSVDVGLRMWGGLG